MKKETLLHFWWHFHQPLYRMGARSLLPWVKLHTCRDYLDMGKLVERNPDAHVTFNFTPVLLEQMQEWVDDPFFEIFSKPFRELNIQEKVFLLRHCFNIHWRTFVYPVPEFSELLSLRGTHPDENELVRQAELWNRQMIDDLKTFYLLSWCGQTIRSDARAQDLIKKGRKFSHDDVIFLIDVMKEYYRQVIPLYKKMKNEGRIAITTTPYYHPILPILVSPEGIARDHPGLDVPPISADMKSAEKQVTSAREYHQLVFSHPPDGFWPAEGSVSEEMLPLIRDFPLIATDEAILHASDAETKDSAFLYLHPDLSGGSLCFRDTDLSNRISFIYGGIDEERAVEDFMRHLTDRYREGIVHIILDGENAWGGYPNLGRTFLEKLYRAGIERHGLVHAGEVVEKGQRKKISRLHSGSWIDMNFKIWIGDPVKNHAWLLIEEAKQVFRHTPGDQIPSSFLAAQGSDWFWWYGEGNVSPYEPQFDQLFREHLKNAYDQTGLIPPAHLDDIFTQGSIVSDKWPSKTIHPVINGKVDSYFEWQGAGRFVDKGDSMMGLTSPFKEMHYGFDHVNLYIRLDLIPSVSAKEALEDIEVYLSFHAPREVSIKMGKISEGGNHKAGIKIVIDRILEMSVPFSSFAGEPEKNASFFIFMKKGVQVLYRYPKAGFLTLTLPGKYFDEEMWSV